SGTWDQTARKYPEEVRNVEGCRLVSLRRRREWLTSSWPAHFRPAENPPDSQICVANMLIMRTLSITQYIKHRRAVFSERFALLRISYSDLRRRLSTRRFEIENLFP